MKHSVLEKNTKQTLDGLMSWFAKSHDNFFFAQKKILMSLGLVKLHCNKHACKLRYKN